MWRLWALTRHLGASEDVEHEGQAHADQLLAVVFLPDGGELSEQRQRDPCPGLLLRTAQRFQPHVQLPRDACPKGGRGEKRRA